MKLFSLAAFFTFFVFSLSAQSYRLLVTDGSDEPLFGVLIVDAGGQLLTESDLSGQAILSSSLAANDSLELRLFGFATLVGTPNSLGWQTNRLNKVALEPAAQLLSTVAVVGRRNELARDIPYQVETVDRKAIAALQSSNSADALADLSGVYVQKSQFGGGSPVVRGFEANRVLLVVDGVRMNNAIYRNGHLQNAITVDVNSLDRMELIYGPGSLAYGSDALGGVIHFRTRTPAFSVDGGKWSFGLQSSIASAANSKAGSWQLEYGTVDFASYTQISISDFGDLRAGDNRPSRFPDFGKRPFYLERIDGQDSLIRNDNINLQVSTGYRQFDLLQKFRYRFQEGLELKANFQAGTSSDIPRYDQLTEVRDGALRWAEWYYGPQTRLLGSLRLDDRRGRKFWDISTILLSHQFVAEDRIQRRNGDPEREISEVDVNSTNLHWDLSKSLKNDHRINYGFDARHDQVNSLAEIVNIEENTLANEGAASRYPSEGSQLSTLGAFVDFRYHLSSHLEAQIGGRYSYQRLFAQFGSNDPVEWPVDYLRGITNTDDAFTFATSLNYRNDPHRLRLLFAQGFRAPNVDDFAKFRERNGFIQVPNPALESERSYSLELGYDLDLKNWSVHLVAYASRLNNAIVRSSFQLPNGDDFFLSFSDTLRVQANVNAEEALIYGFDLDLRRQLGPHFQLRTDFHWLRGTRKEAATGRFFPQDHIPPPYGKASIVFDKGKFNARFRIRYQFTKPIDRYAVSSYETSGFGEIISYDRTGTSDNFELTPIDPITGEYTGAYGWFTLNLNTQYQISEQFTLRLGIENILDTHYRTFASGVSAPGRNVMLGVSWSTF